MKNKFIRKIVIYLTSVLIVGGVVCGVLAFQEAREQAALEATYTEAKSVMTQEEMEALYDAHKKDAWGENLNEETSQEEVLAENELKDSSVETRTEGDGTSGETDSKVYEGCPVDFAGMWETNEDVYAWITVPGTVIDYPILQHATDNTYYLNYNIDGSYGYPGCIYTENMNSKEFTDNNTVIYGHNMKNGTMFAGLHKFEDAAFSMEVGEVSAPIKTQFGYHLIYLTDKQG